MNVIRSFDGLVSWLKYFDVEYLTDDLCAQLAGLDINDPSDRSQAMQLAVQPEFESLNDISKRSMLAILGSSLGATDVELTPLFSRVGMPFEREVERPVDFLQALWQTVTRVPRHD